MAEQLALLGEWHRAAPGTCVVFDTNVLLHYQPLDQIDWLTELDERAVRLVPLRVLQELDEEKHAAKRNSLTEPDGS
jgi:hypothetical protein